VFKKIAQSSAIVLALTFLTAAPSRMLAQQVVTGGNPMPSGEAVGTPPDTSMIMALVALNMISVP